MPIDPAMPDISQYPQVNHLAHRLKIKPSQYLKFEDTTTPNQHGLSSISGTIHVMNRKTGDKVMSYSVTHGRMTKLPGNYQADSCHQFVKDAKIDKLHSVQEVEDLPGKYKRFTFDFPTIEYRQVTVAAKSMKEALSKADRQIKSQVAKKHRRPREGNFRLLDVRFTNFKELLYDWSALFRPTRYRYNPLANVAVPLEPQHGVFEFPTATELDIPDSYFAGGKP